MLALITAAVAAAVAGASIVVNAASQIRGEFGDADAMVRLDATHPEGARAAVAAAQRQFGPVEVIAHLSVAVPGSALPVDVRAQDPNGIYSRPMLALIEGRYPAGATEVALTDDVAELLSAGIGDHFDLGGVRRTVVGRVENPSDLRDEFALIAPGDAPAESLTVLLKSDSRIAGPGGPEEPQLGIIRGGTDQGGVVAGVLVATTLAMALVCLVASAGFVVVAQRRQRQLGLLAAVGATERHLRLAMLANGAIVGAVAALAGGLIGVLGWMGAAPAVETAAGHRIGRLDVPWSLVAGCMVLAVVAATAAAWWPARAMARMPVMAALSGRPAPLAPVHRSLAVALGLLVIGAGATASARPTAEDVRPVVLIAGLLAMVVGMVFASPAAIRALAGPAGRLPVAARLALRDLVRYQARAAAALAAIALVTGISVAVVVVAKANEYRSDEGNLSNRQLLIQVGDLRTALDPNLRAADRARLDAAGGSVAAVLPGATMLTLDVAMPSTSAADAGKHEPISVATPMANGFRGLGFPFVATPELLRQYGIDPATIADGTDLLTALPGNVLLLDFTVRPDRTGSESRVQRVDLPSYTSAPMSLVTENAMRRHGWIPARAGWLVESSRPLTKEQVASARAAAAEVGLTIEVRSGQDHLATMRTVVTTAGGLLALAIVAMTIGLIRSESVRDLRTLTATGAGPRTRRAVTASSAGALALLAVVLSILGGYIALVAAYHADLGRLTPPPLAHLLLVACGLPSLAAGAGWLLAGREPQSFARHALD